MQESIEIVPFTEQYKLNFRDLNVAWLQQYFSVEPIDEEIFANPQHYILDNGGHIFFAKYSDNIVGTCALIKKPDGDVELAKMAVEERVQGRGIGQALLEAAIAKAIEMGLTRLMLYSNTKLEPAIHLYKKYGFKEVPLDSTGYKRSNIKMEKSL